MTEKRFEVIDGFEAYTDKSIKCIRDTETTEIYSMENTLEASSTCKKLNALHELADGNEEQLLKVMTYLHDNHYEIWEEVNKECYE